MDQAAHMGGARDVTTDKAPAVPALARIAGIIWIAMGCLMVPIVVAVRPASIHQRDIAGATFVASGIQVLLTLIAVSLVYIGAKTRQGKLRHMLAAGVSSSFLGVVLLIAGAYWVDGSTFGAGFGFCIAGLCAIVTRPAYMDYRRTKQ
jgi:hypothetical protein